MRQPNVQQIRKEFNSWRDVMNSLTHEQWIDLYIFQLETYGHFR
jgi:hypothetical protein